MNPATLRLHSFFKSTLFRVHMAFSVLLFGGWLLFFLLELLTQNFFVESLLVLLSFISLGNLVVSYFVYISKLIDITSDILDLQQDYNQLSKYTCSLETKIGIIEAMANDALARQVEAEAILKEDAHRRELARARDARYRENKRKRRQQGQVTPQKITLVPVEQDEGENEAVSTYSSGVRSLERALETLNEEEKVIAFLGGKQAHAAFITDITEMIDAEIQHRLSYDTVPLESLSAEEEEERLDA